MFCVDYFRLTVLCCVHLDVCVFFLHFNSSTSSSSSLAHRIWFQLINFQLNRFVCVSFVDVLSRMVRIRVVIESRKNPRHGLLFIDKTVRWKKWQGAQTKQNLKLLGGIERHRKMSCFENVSHFWENERNWNFNVRLNNSNNNKKNPLKKMCVYHIFFFCVCCHLIRECCYFQREWNKWTMLSIDATSILVYLYTDVKCKRTTQFSTDCIWPEIEHTSHSI